MVASAANRPKTYFTGILLHMQPELPLKSFSHRQNLLTVSKNKVVSVGLLLQLGNKARQIFNTSYRGDILKKRSYV